MAAIITARAASGFGFSQDDIVARIAAAIAADVDRAKVRREHSRLLECEGIGRDVGIEGDR